MAHKTIISKRQLLDTLEAHLGTLPTWKIKTQLSIWLKEDDGTLPEHVYKLFDATQEYLSGRLTAARQRCREATPPFQTDTRHRVFRAVVATIQARFPEAARPAYEVGHIYDWPEFWDTMAERLRWETACGAA